MATIITFRPFSPRDKREWYQVMSKAFKNTPFFRKPNFRIKRINYPLSLVAEINGQVVGLIDVAIRRDKAEIENIAVTPKFQRKKIGSRLIKLAIKELLKRY